MSMRSEETSADPRLNGARRAARPDQADSSTSKRVSLGESKHLARRDADDAARWRQTKCSEPDAKPTDDRNARTTVMPCRRNDSSNAKWAGALVTMVCAPCRRCRDRSSGSQRTPAFLVARILLYENREFVFQRSDRFPSVPRLPQLATRRKEGTSIDRRKHGSEGGIDLPVRLLFTCSNSSFSFAKFE